MLNARALRLRSDYEGLTALVQGSGEKLNIMSSRGRPPEEYVLEYRCRSIESLNNGKPVFRNSHRVKYRLPARYPLPSAPPHVQMMDPVFNPHVYPNQEICLGTWQTSESLGELAQRIGALLQFDRRTLNLYDPANPKALEWVQQNMLLLPTDDCTFGIETFEMEAFTPHSDVLPISWKEL